MGEALQMEMMGTVVSTYIYCIVISINWYIYCIVISINW